MSSSEGSSPAPSNAATHEAALAKYASDLPTYGLDTIEVSTIHKDLRANDRTLFVRFFLLVLNSTRRFSVVMGSRPTRFCFQLLS